MTEFSSNIRLGGQIGSGYFGDVYEGVDAIGNKVAIKLLRRLPGESDSAFVDRELELLQEGERLRAARHRNVVQVKDVGRHAPSGRVALITEFCPGGSVEAVYAKGPVDVMHVRDLATQAALGLEAVHARGMIHRDIKPGNILIGTEREAKLGDFGLVTDRIVVGYASAQGYQDHLAPEVHRDSLTSVRSDVWAFGMTIYRLLHGHPWYVEVTQGAQPRDVIQAGGFAARLHWLPHVGADWRRFVRRCMHDDTQRRYADAQALLEGLAGLSVDPNWSCQVTPPLVEWTCGGSRAQWRVRWRRVSARRHEWVAESRTASRWSVRRRSSGRVGRARAERELTSFFAA